MLNILRLAIGRVYRRRQCSVFQLSNSSRSRNTATTIANRLFGIDRQHQAHSKPRPQPSYSDEMGDTVNENGASSSTTPTAAAAATSNLPGLVKFLELVGNLKVIKIATNRDDGRSHDSDFYCSRQTCQPADMRVIGNAIAELYQCQVATV